jgi:hypothetical protein
MKSRHELRKPAKENYSGLDELKKSRKLKPLKKEKNVKRALFEEIDELEDVEINFRMDDEEDFFDEEDDY